MPLCFLWLQLSSTLDVAADGSSTAGAAGGSAAAAKLLAVLKERPYCAQARRSAGSSVLLGTVAAVVRCACLPLLPPSDIAISRCLQLSTIMPLS